MNRLLLYWIPAFSALAVGMVLFMMQYTYGLGLSPDSAQYTAAADSILQGGEIIRYDDDIFVQWAPLLPILMAGLSFVGQIDTVEAGIIISFISTMATAFLWSALLIRYLHSRLLAGIGILLIIFSVPMLHVSAYLWSESLFILLITITLLTLNQYLQRQQLRFLFLCAVAAALTWFTRYAGFTVVITAGIVLLLNPRQTIIHRVVDALVFAVLASTPLVLWLLRNLHLTGTLTGDRASSQTSWFENLERSLGVIASWFIPEGDIRQWLFIGIMFGIFILFVVAVWRKRDRTPPLIPIFFLFGILYFASNIVTHSLISLGSQIDHRFMSPMYFPLLLTGLWSIDQIIASLSTRRKVPAYLIAVTCTVLVIVQSISMLIHDVGVNIAWSYGANKWRTADIVEYLQESPLNGLILTNAAPAVYLYSHTPARWNIRQLNQGQLRRLSTMYRDALSKGEPAYFVRFAPGYFFLPGVEWAYYDTGDFPDVATFEVFQQFETGRIYEIIAVPEN